jgi:hypothetical protein
MHNLPDMHNLRKRPMHAPHQRGVHIQRAREAVDNARVHLGISWYHRDDYSHQ